MTLRTIPIRRASHRAQLFMGGDRELVMLSALIAVALVFTAQDFRATIFGIVFWIAALYVLRLMAKSDPKLRHVYLRHRLYQTYYPPRGTFFSQGRKI